MPIIDHLSANGRYMKDSMIVEQGKHEELITLDGGYASMYRVQAAAFKE